MPGFEIAGESGDGRSALEAIRTLHPALVLLDVQLPEMTGIEVLDALAPDEVPPVIFVTAYDQYALRAFELHAFDYLLKPFDEDRFERVLNRAAMRIRKGQVEVLGAKLLELLRALKVATSDLEEPAPAPEPASPYMERIAVKSRGRLILIKTEEIDWIAGAGVYVEVYAGPERHLLRQTLRKLEAGLNPARFVRIHRSTIVNVDRVKELVPHLHGEYVVVLDNGKRLKLSRSYRDKLELILGNIS